MVENILDGIEVQLDADYLADKTKWDSVAEKLIFGSRLGEYRYYDMDQVIGVALEKAKELLK